jgi:hypothetical protein
MMTLSLSYCRLTPGISGRAAPLMKMKAFVSALRRVPSLCHP